MAVLGRLGTLLHSQSWGGSSLISLFISVLSGVVLALQYDTATPFYSTVTIELIIPYGAFWRSLHYFSSQAFFLFLLAHAVVVLWKNEISFPRAAWIRLCCSLPCAVLLLFTGYVLRGDATGIAAGAIAEHICLSIPLIGRPLNDLLFDLDASGMRKVYVQHLIGLVVLGGVAVWPHLRRYSGQWNKHLLLTAATLLLSSLVSAPIEPERYGLLFIAGPWFFLGLQELLRYWPALIAGVLMPLIPLILLFYLPTGGATRRWTILLILFWLLLYGGLSIACQLRV